VTTFATPSGLKLPGRESDYLCYPFRVKATRKRKIATEKVTTFATPSELKRVWYELYKQIKDNTSGRLIPEGVAVVAHIFLRDAHILPI
jgi:hypothetical protein